MKKVLIVDDQSDIRKLIRITIGKSFAVLDAADGETALRLVRSHQPNVVVLDIMMPGELDGLKVLGAIRADAGLAGVKVILVTARGQATDYEVGMSAGASAYITKPFSPVELVNIIKDLMN